MLTPGSDTLARCLVFVVADAFSNRELAENPADEMFGVSLMLHCPVVENVTHKNGVRDGVPSFKSMAAKRMQDN